MARGGLLDNLEEDSLNQQFSFNNMFENVESKKRIQKKEMKDVSKSLDGGKLKD